MTPTEHAVKSLLEGRGFTVHRNGWPDFLCSRKVELGGPWGESTHGVMAVEVKAGKDHLRPEQKVVHGVLRAVRIPVYVVRPHNSLTQLRTRHILSEREKYAINSAVAKISEQIAELQTRLDNLRLVAEGAAHQVHALEPMLEPIDVQSLGDAAAQVVEKLGKSRR
jgi:hypothetical protein